MLISYKHSIRTAISIVLILAILTVSLSGRYCLAHSRQEHDKILDRILFGSEYGLPGSWTEKVDALHRASFLAVDQYNGNGQEDLDALRAYGVSSLPRNISAIDFDGNYTHRQYTHMGWDHTYYNDRAHWSERKRILVNTVGEVFNFTTEWSSDTHHFEYNRRAQNLAALIYYIHLLGDYQYDYGEYPHHNYSSYMMPLASGTTGVDSIISEFKETLQVLFDDQTNSNSYNGLISSLTASDSEIFRIVGSSRGDLTDGEYEALNDATSDVINALQDYVPGLLRNEAYFNNTFPENGESSSDFWDWLPWNKNS